MGRREGGGGGRTLGVSSGSGFLPLLAGTVVPLPPFLLSFVGSVDDPLLLPPPPPTGGLGAEEEDGEREGGGSWGALERAGEGYELVVVG